MNFSDTERDHLNFDIVDNILSRLDEFELINCLDASPVCTEVVHHQLSRRFKRFIISQRWVTTNGTFRWDELQTLLRYIGPTMRMLIVAPYDHSLRNRRFVYFNSNWSIPRIRISQLYKILNMCPELKDLQIINQCMFGDDGLRPPILHSLQSISFIECDISEMVIRKILRSCSESLLSITFQHTTVTGICLEVAPISVRRLGLINCNYYDEHLIAYTLRNTNLEKLIIDRRGSVDITTTCGNLNNLSRLELNCGDLRNFTALAHLRKLVALNLVLKSNLFYQYTALTAASQLTINLTYLKLILTNIDVTPEMAQSFSQFVNLKKLEIKAPPQVTHHNRIIPFLQNLQRLTNVHLHGAFDLPTTAGCLGQIKCLCILVDVSSSNPSVICYLTQLESICINSDLFDNRNQIENENVFLNKFIEALAKLPRLTDLAIRSDSTIELNESTLIALKTSCLKSITLFGVFKCVDVIKLIRNTPSLRKLKQISWIIWSLSERKDIEAICPGQLSISVAFSPIDIITRGLNHNCLIFF